MTNIRPTIHQRINLKSLYPAVLRVSNHRYRMQLYNRFDYSAALIDTEAPFFYEMSFKRHFQPWEKRYRFHLKF